MKKPFRIAMIVVAALMVAQCVKTEPEGETGTSVIASIFPVSDIARNIAGDSITVDYAVPANANPHSYEPDPSTVKKLRGAAVFIGVHRELDGWIEKFLPRSARKIYLADIFGKHGHHDNPHFWLSVQKAKIIASSLRDSLTLLYPEKSRTFDANLAAYHRDLDALDVRIAALFSGIQIRGFIQRHPAWDYFAADYGLIITGTVESGHGDSPSLREFRALAEKARRRGVTIVVADLGEPGGTAMSLVAEIGGHIVQLDGIGDPAVPEKSSYIAMMEDNAKRLAAALAGRK